jgi:hypothetical protein
MIRTLLAAGGPAALALAAPAAAQVPRYVSELSVPPGVAAEIAAYDALATVACSGCPGGRRNEGDPALMLADRLKAAGISFEERLARIQPQQGTAWRGSEVFGMITFTAEGNVGGFPCRRYRQSISRGERRAERDRLMCLGRRDARATEDQWVTVY